MLQKRLLLNCTTGSRYRENIEKDLSFRSICEHHNYSYETKYRYAWGEQGHRHDVQQQH